MDQEQRRLERRLEVDPDDVPARRELVATLERQGRSFEVVLVLHRARIEREAIDRILTGDGPVLVVGERGTWKEGLARLIHSMSARASRSFRVGPSVDLSSVMIESELFGYLKSGGPFRAEGIRRYGILEEATGGTVLLGLTDLSTRLRKLVRLLETKTIVPLGTRDEVSVDVRLIFDAEPEEFAARGPIVERVRDVVGLPSLAERRADVPLLLARHGFREISSEARDALLAYEWPGGDRELAALVERLRALRVERVEREDLADPMQRPLRSP